MDVAVTFTAVENIGSSCTFLGGEPNVTVITDPSGIATAINCTGNNVPGTFSIFASVAGFPVPGQFTVHLLGVPTQLLIYQGAGLSTQCLTVYHQPIILSVLDSGYNALKGYSVSFSAPTIGPTCAFNGTGNSSIVLPVDPNGKVTAFFVASRIPGLFGITISVVEVTSVTTTLSENNTVISPSSMTAVSGSLQVVNLTENYQPFSVLVMDGIGPIGNEIHASFLTSFFQVLNKGSLKIRLELTIP